MVLKIWKGKPMKINFEKISELIQSVEEKYKEQSGQGKTKKQEVIDVINALVDVPMIPEWVEAKILGYIIDGMVYVFNTYIWKKSQA